MILEGGCQCGHVRFRAEVDNVDAYLCHCRMCQKASGQVAMAFKNLDRARVTWLSEPDWYASSPIAKRPFCSRCGTPLGFQYNEGDTMDLAIGAFDDPVQFVPTSHFGAESMLDAWQNTAHLPRENADQWAPLQNRWAQAESVSTPSKKN